jgi:flagellar assembly factor FliW
MNIIQTKIGTIDIEKHQIITFESGLPGFENLSKFIVYTDDSIAPILWLVSIEDSKIAFPVIPPKNVRIDYSFFIPQEVVDYLEISKEEDLVILSVLTIPQQSQEISLNLIAPMLISLINKKGIQLILENTQYKSKHLLKEELERSQNLLKQSAGEDNAGSDEKNQ